MSDAAPEKSFLQQELQKVAARDFELLGRGIIPERWPAGLGPIFAASVGNAAMPGADMPDILAHIGEASDPSPPAPHTLAAVLGKTINRYLDVSQISAQAGLGVGLAEVFRSVSKRSEALARLTLECCGVRPLVVAEASGRATFLSRGFMPIAHALKRDPDLATRVDALLKPQLHDIQLPQVTEGPLKHPNLQWAITALFDAFAGLEDQPAELQEAIIRKLCLRQLGLLHPDGYHDPSVDIRRFVQFCAGQDTPTISSQEGTKTDAIATALKRTASMLSETLTPLDKRSIETFAKAGDPEAALALDPTVKYVKARGPIKRMPELPSAVRNPRRYHELKRQVSVESADIPPAIPSEIRPLILRKILHSIFEHTPVNVLIANQHPVFQAEVLRQLCRRYAELPLQARMTQHNPITSVTRMWRVCTKGNIGAVAAEDNVTIYAVKHGIRYTIARLIETLTADDLDHLTTAVQRFMHGDDEEPVIVLGPANPAPVVTQGARARKQVSLSAND